MGYGVFTMEEDARARNALAHAQHIRYTYNGHSYTVDHIKHACAFVCLQKNHQLFTGPGYGDCGSSEVRGGERGCRMVWATSTPIQHHRLPPYSPAKRLRPYNFHNYRRTRTHLYRRVCAYFVLACCLRMLMHVEYYTRQRWFGVHMFALHHRAFAAPVSKDVRASSRVFVRVAFTRSALRVDKMCVVNARKLLYGRPNKNLYYFTFNLGVVWRCCSFFGVFQCGACALR